MPGTRYNRYGDRIDDEDYTSYGFVDKPKTHKADRSFLVPYVRYEGGNKTPFYRFYRKNLPHGKEFNAPKYGALREYYAMRSRRDTYHLSQFDSFQRGVFSDAQKMQNFFDTFFKYLVDHTKNGYFADVIFDESFMSGISEKENIMYRMLATFMNIFINRTKDEKPLLSRMKQVYFSAHPKEKEMFQQVRQGGRKCVEDVSQHLVEVFDEGSKYDIDPNRVRPEEESYMSMNERGDILPPMCFFDEE